jgi:hypothetical protein
MVALTIIGLARQHESQGGGGDGPGLPETSLPQVGHPGEIGFREIGTDHGIQPEVSEDLGAITMKHSVSGCSR